MGFVVSIVSAIVSGARAALGAIGGAAAALGPIGGALFQTGIGMAISSLLAPKPPRGALTRRNSTFAIRQPSPSRRIPYGVSRLGGIYFYAETTAPAGAPADDRTLLYIVLGIGDGPISSIDKMYFNEDEVSLTALGTDTNGRTTYGATSGTTYNPTSAGQHATVQFYTGAAGQPADATLVAASNSKWTASHTLDGIAYAVVGLLWNPDIYKQGVPNISFEVTGRNDIYDPRTAGTGYSNNAALCLAHYLTTAKTGPNVTYATELDDTTLQAAANVCDESVSLNAGGTESRYTANGFVDLAEKPEDVINDFKVAMAGWMVYAGGRFKIYAGAFETPTFLIDEDMMAGPVTVQNKLPKRERFNLVKGVYQAPENLYQPTDFPSVTNAGYESSDGEELSRDMELVFTTSPARAQRIAKIELERSRQELVVSLVCNLRALPAEAGKTVSLTLDRFGWSAKAFFVQSSTIGLLGDGTVGVSLSLREIDSSVFSWTPAGDEKAVADAPALLVGSPKVGDLTADPDGSSDFDEDEFPIRVRLTTETDDATIRYAKTHVPYWDGDGLPYNDAQEEWPRMTEGETLYARAFKPGYEASDAITQTYKGTNSINDLSGVHGRFRVDVPASLNLFASAGVSRWSNLGALFNALSDSRGGYDIVSAAGFPTYDAEKFALFFDGVDDRLYTLDGTRGGSAFYLGYRLPSLPLTVAIALKTPASFVSTSATLMCSIPVGGNEQIRIKMYYGYLQACMTDSYGTESCSGGAYAGATDTFYTVVARFSNASRQMRVNKSDDTASTTAITGDVDGPMGLCALVPSATTPGGHSEFFNGYIQEVITFNSSLSDADADTVADYFSAKYNP